MQAPAAVHDARVRAASVPSLGTSDRGDAAEATWGVVFDPYALALRLLDVDHVIRKHLVFVSTIVFAACGGTVHDQPAAPPDGGSVGEPDARPDVEPDAKAPPDALPDQRGNDPNCPSAIPTSACQAEIICSYEDENGCPLKLECIHLSPSEDGIWLPLLPTAGGACAMPGQICEYQTGGENAPQWGALACGDSRTWEVHDLCPASVPQQGSPCTHDGLHCNYGKCPDKPAPVTGADCYGTTWSTITFCDPVDAGG
jgi:hypothetical protein